MFGFSPISSAPISALSITSNLITNSLSQYVNVKIAPLPIITSTNNLLKQSYILNHNTNSFKKTTDLKLQTINSNLLATIYRTFYTDIFLISLNIKNIFSDSLIYSVNNLQITNNILLRSTSNLAQSTNIFFQASYYYINNTNMFLLLLNMQTQHVYNLLLKQSLQTTSTNSFHYAQNQKIYTFDSLILNSFSKTLLSQMVLWRTITGDSNNALLGFYSESSGQYVFSTPQNIDDVITDNRKILIKAGWGGRDISPKLSSQASINVSVPVRANGALFSVYDDRLPDVILQDPVAVSFTEDLITQKALIGTVPTAKTKIKSFNAPVIDKSMQLIEFPKKRKL